MVADISLVPFQLRIVYNHCRQIFFTSDNLFSRFTKFILLLPPNTTNQSFSLVPLFLHTLPFELQEVVRLKGFILLDINTLVTHLSQEQVIQHLCAHTTVVFKTLIKENHRIQKSMTTFNHGRDTSQHFLVDFNYSGSIIEQTIERYFTPEALSTEQPLVTHEEGKDY